MIVFRICSNNGVLALRLQSGFIGTRADEYEGPVFTFATKSSFEMRSERGVIAPWTGDFDELTMLTKSGHIKLISQLRTYVPFSNQMETGLHGEAAAAKELLWGEGASREDFYRLIGVPMPATSEEVEQALA